MNKDHEELIEEIKRFKESIFVAISALVLLATVVCLGTRLPDYIGICGGITFLGFLFAGIRRRVGTFFSDAIDVVRREEANTKERRNRTSHLTE